MKKSRTVRTLLGKGSPAGAQVLHWRNLSLEQGCKRLCFTVTLCCSLAPDCQDPFHQSCNAYTSLSADFFVVLTWLPSLFLWKFLMHCLWLLWQVCTTLRAVIKISSSHRDVALWPPRPEGTSPSVLVSWVWKRVCAHPQLSSVLARAQIVINQLLPQIYNFKYSV